MSRYIAACFVLFLVLPGLAQDQPARQRQRPRGGQGQGFAPGAMWDRISNRLTSDLALDDQQQAQLKEIVTQFQGQSQGRPDPDAMNQFFDQVQTILNEDQSQKLAGFRERMSQFGRNGQGPGQGPGGMFGMLRDLPETLQLDEQQKARYDELTAQLREQGRQRFEEMQPLMEEMRQAREAGDEARVQQIREQMQQARAQGGNGMETFFSELDKVLRDDQKAKLAELRQQMPGRGRQQSKPVDVRTVLEAVKRIDLDSAQRDKIKKIEQQAMRSTRIIDKQDAQAQAKLATDVKQQIVKVLRADQAQQFERLLSGQGTQRGRGARGQNRPQPEQPAQPDQPAQQPDDNTP